MSLCLGFVKHKATRGEKNLSYSESFDSLTYLRSKPKFASIREGEIRKCVRNFTGSA
jgi:hypothetical protein